MLCRVILLSCFCLLLTVKTSAGALVDCSFSRAEGFIDNGKSKQLLKLNHDRDGDGVKDSIRDSMGNVWYSTAGTGLKSYLNSYAGTEPETYILPGDTFEIIINPVNIPKEPTAGWLSVNLRLGTSGQTNFKFQGWNKDQWETLLKITDLSRSYTRKIVNHPITDISLYSKYRVVQEGGTKPVKATMDNFIVSSRVGGDNITASKPVAYNQRVVLRPGQSVGITLTGKNFTFFKPPSDPRHGIIIPIGDCGGAGILHYRRESSFGGTDSFTYTSGEFSSTGKLTYIASNSFVGKDYFTYTTGNGIMNSKPATVTVEVYGQVLNYGMTEVSGSKKLIDRSTFKRDVNMQFVDSSHYALDGKSLIVKDDLFTLKTPSVGLKTNTLTIAAWIKPASKVKIDNFTAVLMTRSGDDANGLCFYNESLGFCWDGSKRIYNWDSGLKAVKGEWQFVALVITPKTGTVYMGLPVPGALKSKTLDGKLTKQHLGTMQIGGEIRTKSSDRKRTFIGALKNVRMWNYSMSEKEIKSIFNLEKRSFK